MQVPWNELGMHWEGLGMDWKGIAGQRAEARGRRKKGGNKGIKKKRSEQKYRNEEMKKGMEMAYQCITMHFLQCIPRHLAQRISRPFWKRIYWNCQHIDNPFLQRHWQCISSPFRVHYNAFRGIGNRALRSADLLFGILPGQLTFPSLRDDHMKRFVTGQKRTIGRKENHWSKNNGWIN